MACLDIEKTIFRNSKFGKRISSCKSGENSYRLTSVFERVLDDGSVDFSINDSLQCFVRFVKPNDLNGPEFVRLLEGFKDMEEVFVNGDADHRVAGNLNISFNFVEGESLMMALRDLAVSSGSACTSASLEPSYVLRAIGLNDELAHSSLRMTIGRFTTEEEIDFAIEKIREAVGKLRELSPLWDMHKDGIDLSQVKWAAH